jgi:very-short-patch-repair endonuclease
MRLELLARDGILSSADAARHGLDRHALSRLVHHGRLIRLTRGWFALAGESALSLEERHRLTALALGRQFCHRAVVSHHSMVVCRRLPTFGVDLRTVHLTSAIDDNVVLPDGSRRRDSVTVRRSGVVIHRAVPGVRLAAAEPDGRPAPMPLAFAVVQAGLLAGPEAALVPADAALRAGSVTPQDLMHAVHSFVGHRGIGPIRSAMPCADGRHESPGETRTAYLMRALGFQFEPQVWINADGRDARADFRIMGTRVLVEFDGAVKYADGDARTLFAEKQREDALRRAGWVVVRLVWTDLDHPERVRARILDALARSM